MHFDDNKKVYVVEVKEKAASSDFLLRKRIITPEATSDDLIKGGIFLSKKEAVFVSGLQLER